jgi:hypothetical protein
MFKKFITKLTSEFHSLIWTAAGTLLVLITLSGDVQKLAIKISVAALILHLIGVLVKRDSNES